MSDQEWLVQRWSYEGVTIGTDNHGKLSLEQLKEFVMLAERLGESGVTIVPYAYGLRATRMAGEGGPYIDWRD